MKKKKRQKKWKKILNHNFIKINMIHKITKINLDNPENLNKIMVQDKYTNYANNK